MPKIIFMGTPEFAVPSLECLLNAGYDVSLAVCQPDRKKGRGLKSQFSPIKTLALERDIEVFQPKTFKDPAAVEKIASFKPDFLAVTAYGKILPSTVLELPSKGCVNIHASLLPKWRGASPVNFALLNGDSKTGVCSMLMDEKMDTGDILLTVETDIYPDENAGRLSRRLSRMGGNLLAKTLSNFDRLSPVKQDHSQASYSRLITKKDSLIDWLRTAEAVGNHFRAFTPPGVYTEFRGKRLIITELKKAEAFQSLEAPPGSVISTGEELAVACGKGAVSILRCQPENKKSMAAKDFVNGYRVKPQEILG